MKSNYKLLVGVVAGVLVEAAGNNAIRGQQVKTPPGYLISEADAITGPTAVKEYGAKVPETLAPFNGHYHLVVRGGRTEGLGGNAPAKGILVIAFDSAEQAHAWYDSPAYAAIRPIRLAAVKGRMFIVEGSPNRNSIATFLDGSSLPKSADQLSISVLPERMNSNRLIPRYRSVC